MQIKPTNGTYLATDDQGYLIRDPTLGNFQLKWKKVVDECVEIYQQVIGDALHSIYVRGSVARGTAIDKVSDIDFMIVIKNEVALENKEAWHKILCDSRSKIIISNPFITDIEMPIQSLSWLHNSQSKLFIKYQSVCVLGEDVINSLPGVHISKAYIHAHKFEKNLDQLKSRLSRGAHLQDHCRWIMKRTVRIGQEIIAVRENRFTRDLYLCWQSFSHWYPEKSDAMYKVLELAINPTDDPEYIREVLDPMKGFLVEEIKKHIQIKVS